MSDDTPDATTFYVKKYGAGTASARVSGPARYAEIAEQCLLRALTCYACVETDLFRRTMREHGVPDEATEDFLRTISISDDAYLAERPR